MAMMSAHRRGSVTHAGHAGDFQEAMATSSNSIRACTGRLGQQEYEEHQARRNDFLEFVNQVVGLIFSAIDISVGMADGTKVTH